MTRRQTVPALVTASLVLMLLNGRSVQAQPQAAAARPIPVEYLQVPDLPVSISLATLEKTEKGYVLKCAADNSSGDQILGITFLLLVVDYENKVRASVSWPAGMHLDSYSGKEFSLKVPTKLSIKSRDRVVLAPEQVFGRESIWRLMNAREFIEAFAFRDEYLTPKVRKVVNQFDPPSAAVRVIY
ncbi:MAG: hypothetical protein QOE77_1458 [Blastocatellia bacterium]|jgi:hypothetical protein|nr:hypothetical protein [Blastocatellia bacterium]